MLTPRRIVRIFAAVLFLQGAGLVFCEGEAKAPQNAPPPSILFQHFFKNTLGALTFGYGMPFAGAALGTVGFIFSEADWGYNRFFYENPDIAFAGVPAVYIGYGMPFVLPVALYSAGRLAGQNRLAVAGAALGQSVLISALFFLPMKAVTGRASPGIITAVDHVRNDSPDDFSGDFEWGFAKRGILSGWPSGHTMTSVSMAAAISEIYDDKPWVKALAWSYAAFIGLSVSVSVHWMSEVFAGALMGWAVGRTVGRDFKRLLQNKYSSVEDESVSVSFYAAPSAFYVNIKF